jgi:hypothetical protein
VHLMAEERYPDHPVRSSALLSEIAEMRKPELTEAQKTLARRRWELDRVIERLRSPGLSPGMARELRKNIAERDIAELERSILD